MKILHLTNFYHDRSGGIKTYLDAQSDYLREKGLPVIHVFPGEVDKKTWQDEHTCIYQVASPEAPYNDEYRIIWNLATVTSIILEEKPDIIEINDKYTLPYAAFFGRVLGSRAKTVGFIHDRLDDILNLYWRPPWLSEAVANSANRIITSCFDLVICASEFVAEELRSHAGHKIEVLNLGVDADLFSPEHYDAALKTKYCPNGEIMLFYAGRLSREKNIVLLPEVLSELGKRGLQCRLIVAGAGPDEQFIREHAGEQLIYEGFIKDRDFYRGLNATADVLLFPSQREPFGLIPLESLASGCPVVCVNQGGPLEYSGCRAVKAVPPTAPDFADAVESLLEEDQEALRKTARKHARLFSWEATFSKQLKVYEELLSD